MHGEKNRTGPSTDLNHFALIYVHDIIIIQNADQLSLCQGEGGAGWLKNSHLNLSHSPHLIPEELLYFTIYADAFREY